MRELEWLNVIFPDIGYWSIRETVRKLTDPDQDQACSPTPEQKKQSRNVLQK